MAVKIRLNRMGAKKNPFYRIVVADSRAPRDGRFIEILGNYDPSQQPAVVNIDEEKAIDWMKKGAQPTDTVRNILSKNGTMAKFAEAKRQKDRQMLRVPRGIPSFWWRDLSWTRALCNEERRSA